MEIHALFFKEDFSIVDFASTTAACKTITVEVTVVVFVAMI